MNRSRYTLQEKVDLFSQSVRGQLVQLMIASLVQSCGLSVRAGCFPRPLLEGAVEICR